MPSKELVEGIQFPSIYHRISITEALEWSLVMLISIPTTVRLPLIPVVAACQTLPGSYPTQSLPPSVFVYNGINYTFPSYRAAGNDNVLAQGQTVKVPRAKYFSVQMLAAAETGLAAGFINGTYADGSSSFGQVLVPAGGAGPTLQEAI